MLPEPAEATNASARRVLVATAAVVVVVALSFYNGCFEPFSLAAMTLAAGAAGAAALAGRRAADDGGRGEAGKTDRLLTRVLGFAIALSVVLLFILPPGFDEDWPRLGLWRPLVVGAGLVALTYRWERPPRAVARARFPLLLALGAMMAAVVIRAVPAPRIDVWDVQQFAAQTLARGENPYSVVYPNLYGPGTPFLDEAVLTADGTHIRWFPYTPLIAVLGVPSWALAHDVRWTMTGCMLFCAWAIRRLGRRAVVAELAAVLFLLQPRAYYVIRQSWTDPIVLAALALTLLAASRWCTREGDGAPRREYGPHVLRGARRLSVSSIGEPALRELCAARALRARAAGWVTTGLACSLLAGSKQFSPLLVVPVFMALPVRGRWKTAAVAGACAVAFMLPFFVASPRGLYDGVVVFQFLSPLRLDALSWLAANARLGGPRLPAWPAFALAALTLAATLKQRVSLAQATAAGGAALMMFFLFNKQAYCNYYWLAAGVLLMSVALDAARWASSAATSR